MCCIARRDTSTKCRALPKKRAQIVGEQTSSNAASVSLLGDSSQVTNQLYRTRVCGHGLTCLLCPWPRQCEALSG